jgi:hypothetical protein
MHGRTGNEDSQSLISLHICPPNDRILINYQPFLSPGHNVSKAVCITNTLLICQVNPLMIVPNREYILVTGATGFIGAHVVDNLLSRGLRVRGATRSLDKGDIMIKARPQHKSSLNFVEIDDFVSPGRLDDAVKGVDAVIHVASVGEPLIL